MGYNTFDDGDFSVAQAISVPKFSQPFDGDIVKYVLEQDYDQDARYYAPLQLNTPHDQFANFYLVSESQLQDLGNGIVRWTRMYAAIPATRNDWTSIAYSFIGYYGSVAIPGVGSGLSVEVGRPRQPRTVPCRIQNDYYLIGTESYANYPNVYAIPTLQVQTYYWPQGSSSGGVFTPTYPAGSPQDIQTGTPTDTIYNNNLWGFPEPTRPTRAQYQAWINAGTEIIVEASQPTRWHGNIFQRQTKFVKAF